MKIKIKPKEKRETKNEKLSRYYAIGYEQGKKDKQKDYHGA